jgi:hypothetical protein
MVNRMLRTSRRIGLPVQIVLLLMALMVCARAETPSEAVSDSPGSLCAAAVDAAQARYAVPKGLLFAIGQVESGRSDPTTHSVMPWPWTVQAQNQSHYFPTKDAAVQWVTAAQAKGIVSIDIGCMQVNLMYHPDAFETLDDAFDPSKNADYAARFLVSLHATTGDWQQAAGLYHSQTLALAIPYAQRVEDALNGRPWGPMAAGLAAPPKPTVLSMLQQAWGATVKAAPVPAAVAASPAGDWSALLSPTPRPPVRRSHRRQAQVLLTYAH